ncbi:MULTISPECIES: NAD(P)/FAD-dependent oxidoreductase [unclassified Pseudomonas]|uniref:NAD(P)/FAD-dependent oxidoreductase n=1 Tax=unclassified Pseudomonas TaxID=196821 RepID=UPI0016615FCD|nr:MULTISPECIES: FAD-binding oxidoreductase [unclassified Pseudomonas]MBD0703994.1 FAD-dependent oxidoreductase [Pseudomonas sp. PSB1]MDD2033901.1 FAD-binding oxidoreductase [Pseudomonas sp. 39167]MEA1030838.1 FAD-binding oxidoreductase [Pseudomonas sp. N-137]
MHSESYWLDTAPMFTGAQTGALPRQVDVAIVGGGLTGLSAARSLALKGASVVVLEAGRVIGEASGRNGGHCSTGVAQDYAGLTASLGADTARAYYQAYERAVQSVVALVEQEQIACDLKRNGKLKLAAKPQHYEGLARTCELIRREVDADVELLSAEQARRETDSAEFHGGLLQRNGVQMHIGRFGVGLAEAAARRGALIYQDTLVKAWKANADGYQVSTSRGSLQAKQILLATGACQHGELSWYRRRIVPVGSFIIATETLSQALLDRMLPQRRSYVTSRMIGNYFRVTPDNRLLFGGRARFAMSGGNSDAKSGKILQAAMAQMFPQLAQVKIDYCWGGLVDMTSDRLPRAGQHGGVYHSMGYSGHGVQMSVHMGQVMAEVMDGKAEANPWGELDWPAIPGHFGKPWFLPAVGLYYRLQDYLH